MYSLSIKRKENSAYEKQPLTTKKLAQDEDEPKQWHTLRWVSRKLDLSQYLISRITSSVFVAIKGTDTRYNLGLDLKFEGKARNFGSWYAAKRCSPAGVCA